MRLNWKTFFLFILALYLLGTVGYILYNSSSLDFFRKSETDSPNNPTPDQTENPAPTKNPAPTAQPEPPRNRSHDTVIWISLDGFRHDYVEKAKPTELETLAAQGRFSTQLIPPYPSLTFPSHVTEATGVPPGTHGIPSNKFANLETGKLLSFPSDPTLLQSEPIWHTSTRQGIRTAVINWPLSNGQTGDLRSAIFAEKYDGSSTPRERLDHLHSILESNLKAATPTRLIMGYIPDVDKYGHRHGPTAPETHQKVRDVSTELGRFTKNISKTWDTHRPHPDAQIHLLLTTDHGMSDITHFVNIDIFLKDLKEKLLVATSGNTAHFYVKDRDDPAAMADTLARLDIALAKIPDSKLYARGKMPKEWGYENPTRAGDRYLELPLGYTFMRSGFRGIRPIGPEDDLRGMHGYPPATVPDMAGYTLLWRYPKKLPNPGTPLDKINATQIHPTVCTLLNITPAPKAKASPINLTIK